MSAATLARFKVAHQSIVDMLDQVQVLSRNYFQAKAKLRDLSERLLAYFGKQDKEFFDQLKVFHKSDRHATKMIEFLLHELKDIKIKYLIFFEKYSAEMSDGGSKSFPRDLTQFINDLLVHLKVEEEYLLPLVKDCPFEEEKIS